ncbi:MAG: hypothetical protein NTZ74_15675 [Chloroflexi bacterium]|nr:hypothetical protein [Chloroflexota bacterium]
MRKIRTPGSERGLLGNWQSYRNGSSIGGPMADYFNSIQPGLGYPVIFAIYSGLFLLSVILLPKIVLKQK